MTSSPVAGTAWRIRPIRFRWLSTIGLGLALGTPFPAAQSTQSPVFRGGADFLSLEVTVVDTDGHPIPGLTAADFTVKVEGQHPPVHTADFLEFGTSGGSAAAGLGRVTTNTSSAPGATRQGGRVIVLLIDDLSQRPGEGTELRVAAERFLPTLDSDDLVGLASTSGFGPVVSPTRNRQAVLAALSSPGTVGKFDDSTGGFFITIPEAIAVWRNNPHDPDVDAVYNQNCPTETVGKSTGPESGCRSKVTAMAKELFTETIRRAAMQAAAYSEVIEALRVAPQPRVLVALTHGIALPDELHPGAVLDAISHAAADADLRFYALVNFEDPVDIRDKDDAVAMRQAGPRILRSTTSDQPGKRKRATCLTARTRSRNRPAEKRLA